MCWVEPHHDSVVLQWVLLASGPLASLLWCAKSGLDFIRLHDAADVSACHLWHGQVVVALLGCLLGPGSVESVKTSTKNSKKFKTLKFNI